MPYTAPKAKLPDSSDILIRLVVGTSLFSKKKIIFGKSYITLYGFAKEPLAYSVSQFDSYTGGGMYGDLVERPNAAYYELVDSKTKEVLHIPRLTSSKWDKVYAWISSHYPRLNKPAIA